MRPNPPRHTCGVPFAPASTYGIEPDVVWGRLIHAEQRGACEWVWILQRADRIWKVTITLPESDRPFWRIGDWWAIATGTSEPAHTMWCLQRTHTVGVRRHPWLRPQHVRRWARRWEILRHVRTFFYDLDYIEVDTPYLVPSPGMEPFLEPFTCEFRMGHTRVRAFLPYSPEYSLKKLVVIGFSRIFQIAHAFRNGEWSRWHEPEFLLLEWYRAPACYEEIMQEVEALIGMVVRRLGGTLKWRGQIVDLAPPWPRARFVELIHRETGIDIMATAGSVTRLRRAVRRRGLQPIPRGLDWNNGVLWLFLTYVEPHIDPTRPLFVIDYPPSMAALARIRPETGLAERFELYLGGLELANGFSELTDPDEQTRRFQNDMRIRRRRSGTPVPPDDGFIEALQLGMPPTGGVALGLDRLIALLTDAPNLAAVLPLPWHIRFALPHPEDPA